MMSLRDIKRIRAQILSINLCQIRPSLVDFVFSVNAHIQKPIFFTFQKCV